MYHQSHAECCIPLEIFSQFLIEKTIFYDTNQLETQTNDNTRIRDQIYKNHSILF